MVLFAKPLFFFKNLVLLAGVSVAALLYSPNSLPAPDRVSLSILSTKPESTAIIVKEQQIPTMEKKQNAVSSSQHAEAISSLFSDKEIATDKNNVVQSAQPTEKKVVAESQNKPSQLNFGWTQKPASRTTPLEDTNIPQSTTIDNLLKRLQTTDTKSPDNTRSGSMMNKKTDSLVPSLSNDQEKVVHKTDTTKLDETIQQLRFNEKTPPQATFLKSWLGNKNEPHISGKESIVPQVNPMDSSMKKTELATSNPDVAKIELQTEETSTVDQDQAVDQSTIAKPDKKIQLDPTLAPISEPTETKSNDEISSKVPVAIKESELETTENRAVSAVIDAKKRDQSNTAVDRPVETKKNHEAKETSKLPDNTLKEVPEALPSKSVSTSDATTEVRGAQDSYETPPSKKFDTNAIAPSTEILRNDNGMDQTNAAVKLSSPTQEKVEEATALQSDVAKDSSHVDKDDTPTETKSDRDYRYETTVDDRIRALRRKAQASLGGAT